MNGYSYTTITMKPGQEPRVGVNLYPDEHARVSFIPFTDTPGSFISLDFADVHLRLGLTAQTTVTDVHVKFARDLFNAVAAFLADCERLRDQHADQAGDSSEQATPGKVA